MWIATEHGYFSTVADRDNPAGPYLWVRARDAKDLIKVRDLGYDIGRITAMVNADYPYRAKVLRTVWNDYVTNQINHVNYTNFKDRVHVVDRKRADVYLDVWHALTRIEADDWKRTKVSAVNKAEAKRNA